jgi:hypothetical protein
VIACTIDEQQDVLPGMAKASRKIWKHSVSAAGMIK